MRINIITLVDITETGAKKGDDKRLANQQANYMTVFQTASLRVNVVPISSEIVSKDIKGLGFGSQYKGEHTFWSLTVEHDVPMGVTEDLLKSDFDLVPFITGLDETVDIASPVFRTQDKKNTNIVFFFEDDK